MLQIIGYESGVVYFYCNKCDDFGMYSITDRLVDDCTFVVEPCCKCGNTGQLYFLHCRTEYKAKKLLAELEALKLSRGN